MFESDEETQLCSLYVLFSSVRMSITEEQWCLSMILMSLLRPLKLNVCYHYRIATSRMSIIFIPTLRCQRQWDTKQSCKAPPLLSLLMLFIDVSTSFQRNSKFWSDSWECGWTEALFTFWFKLKLKSLKVQNKQHGGQGDLPANRATLACLGS